mmetsp:Transcript_10251/g.30849  ORF Transcript_10251/g.30849 Transcript_10251/m.30849 type:complete len:321 (+) Transcript_10251:732-1694(+)
MVHRGTACCLVAFAEVAEASKAPHKLVQHAVAPSSYADPANVLVAVAQVDQLPVYNASKPTLRVCHDVGAAEITMDQHGPLLLAFRRRMCLEPRKRVLQSRPANADGIVLLAQGGQVPQGRRRSHWQWWQRLDPNGLYSREGLTALSAQLAARTMLSEGCCNLLAAAFSLHPGHEEARAQEVARGQHAANLWDNCALLARGPHDVGLHRVGNPKLRMLRAPQAEAAPAAFCSLYIHAVEEVASTATHLYQRVLARSETCRPGHTPPQRLLHALAEAAAARRPGVRRRPSGSGRPGRSRGLPCRHRRHRPRRSVSGSRCRL